MSDTTMGVPAARGVPPVTRDRSRIRGCLVWSAVLLTAFAVYTWLAVTWMPFIRLDDLMNRNLHVHDLWPVLHVFDRVGQRVLCVRPLVVVVLLIAWRFRTWRPLVVGALGVVLLNLLVLVVKLALSRGAPMSGESFFGDGDLYPSGHTSNIMVVYGLCYYFISAYWPVSRRVKRLMMGAVCLVGLIQCTTSILLRWHWFSDLIGGFLIGGVALALTAAIDAALPRGVSPFAVRRRRPDAVAAEGSSLPEPERELQLVDAGPAPLPEVSPRRTPGGSRGAAAGRRPRR